MGWTKLGPVERQLQDTLTLLGRWQGSEAKLWTYTVSHMGLTIRLVQPGRRGNLHIGCSDVSHINGPTKWANAQFEIERRDADTFVVRDRGAGFEVIAGTVSAAENCKPVF